MIIKKVATLACCKLAIVGVAVSCALYFKEATKEKEKSICDGWDCLDSDYKSIGL